MAIVTVNPALCIGCQWCVVICPEGVLFLRSMVTAIVVNQDKCIGSKCKLCEERCPEKAIKVQ